MAIIERGKIARATGDTVILATCRGAAWAARVGQGGRRRARGDDISTVT